MKKIISIILSISIMLGATSLTVFASENEIDKQLIEDVNNLYDKVSSIIVTVGVIKPYSAQTSERLYTAYSFTQEVYDNYKTATEEDYAQAYELLSYALDNMYISSTYAKSTYVLSLDEDNDNGWYDETDWNDFSEKRENLRLSFQTEDEKAISDAYFEVYNSFINMVGKYTVAGDINKDGEVDIADVTEIQKSLADTAKLNGAQKMLASCFDSTYRNCENITIDNATLLQKYIADYEVNLTDEAFPFTFKDTYGYSYNSIICMRMYDSRALSVGNKIIELTDEGVI